MLLCTVSYLFTFVCVLLAVAFFTLLERKSLSYIQSRKGPNKVSLAGLPQPLSDAAKLLTKEVVCPTQANSFVYYIGPVISFLLALMMWEVVPWQSSTMFFKSGALFFLCVSSLNVYGTLLVGWASNSKYALLGSLRAIAQTISYEVTMALVLLFPMFLTLSFSFVDLKESQKWLWSGFLLLPLAAVWFVCCIAETNRAPFDFAEGESELVSGFNIEYGSVGFALIFLAEYANILVMGLLTSVLFFGGFSLLGWECEGLFILSTLLFSFTFIWVRGSFPRFRYDLLMMLVWKCYLPMALSILTLVVSLRALM